MTIARRLPSAVQAALLSGAALAVAACNASAGLVQKAPDGPHRVQVSQVPPPLVLESTAYEVAGSVPLPDVPPGNYPGIHNVFRLSDRIISGSEPHDAEALAQLAAWGVRTSSPSTARHRIWRAPRPRARVRAHPCPLRRDHGGPGDGDRQVLPRARGAVLRPLLPRPPPSPAAAIGRVALDGLERDVAIAEMWQWCSTAAKYEGSIRPSRRRRSRAEQTAYDFDFFPARHASGMREGMIVMTRVWDEVKLGRRTAGSRRGAPGLRLLGDDLAQLLRDCDDAERPEAPARTSRR